MFPPKSKVSAFFFCFFLPPPCSGLHLIVKTSVRSNTIFHTLVVAFGFLWSGARLHGGSLLQSCNSFRHERRKRHRLFGEWDERFAGKRYAFDELHLAKGCRLELILDSTREAAMARCDGEEKWSFWQMAIQMQQESGLSMAEFCRREGLNSSSFYVWRRKLEQADGQTASNGYSSNDQTSLQPRLVPVQVVEDRVAHDVGHPGSVEVASPDGFVLRVPADASSENVRRVLRLMHELA
jgi:transposase-like protein